MSEGQKIIKFLPVPGMPASNGGYALVSGPNQQSAGFGTPRPVSYDSYMGDNPPVAPPEDNLLCLEFQNNTENGQFRLSWKQNPKSYTITRRFLDTKSRRLLRFFSEIRVFVWISFPEINPCDCAGFCFQDCIST